MLPERVALPPAWWQHGAHRGLFAVKLALRSLYLPVLGSDVPQDCGTGGSPSPSPSPRWSRSCKAEDAERSNDFLSTRAILGDFSPSLRGAHTHVLGPRDLVKAE